MTDEECDRLLPELPNLPAEQLHAFARSWNTDGGLAPLAKLVGLPRCELATAKLVYWRLAPEWYLQFRTRAQVPGHAQEGFDLIRQIERRVGEGFYREGSMTFDPAHDELRSGRVVDWTRQYLALEDNFVRDLPGEMYQPSGPGAVPRPPGRPTFSAKERDEAKRKAAEREQKQEQRLTDLKARFAQMEKVNKKRGG